MRIKRIFALVMVICLLASNMAFAASNDNDTHTYTIDELTLIIVDENDNPIDIMPLVSVGKATIRNGYAVNFGTNKGQFYIESGTTVSVEFELENPSLYEVGYKYKQHRYPVVTETSDATDSISVDFMVDESGSYYVYLKNLSSETMHVTGGTITY